MDKIRFEKDGQSIPVEDFAYQEAATREALYGILSSFGVTNDKGFVFSGCVPTLTDWMNSDPVPIKIGDTVAVTAGYISLGGEVLKVVAQSINVPTAQACYYELEVDTTVAAARVVQGGSDFETQEQRRGVLVTTSAPPTARMEYTAPQIATVLRNKVYSKAMPQLLQPDIIGKVMADYFDEGTGLGIVGKEYEGWAMMDGRNSMPDWSAKFIVGYKQGDAAYDLDATGGESTVTLTQAQLPAVRVGGDNNALTGYASGSNPIFTTGTAADLNSPDVTWRVIGSDAAHENKPPFVVAAWVVRIA